MIHEKMLAFKDAVELNERERIRPLPNVRKERPTRRTADQYSERLVGKAYWKAVQS